MEAELIDYLRQHLPKHAVPAAVVELAEFPLTPNKKIDTAALPAPEPMHSGSTADGDQTPDALEQRLAALWAELLGRDHVGPHDHFFRLGGHSLQLMRMAAQVRKTYGVTVPARVLFERPTVAALAAYLRDTSDAG